ncbi:fumarylacetoacetate hydrolase family protein [Thalassobius sp. Cn5-15]|uniref:fumarylacetoacetate hydrolase family protein n=1 Tax=Thalassobius sp. Cn5-15 TaxID=2917763 RepID=UPI001EF22980|nr:fumarylacetoacetate hydrolase family protein [Thalassobius sp. Cn5-15]MCG7492828.1 fumarylacetoacetate hydrolase family protein [Thalassobius sp. Cn5-15]
MSEYLFDPAPQPTIEVQGTEALYPIHRIFCVGRNYEAHAREMGTEVDREAPFYFTKSAHAALPGGATLSYPPGTADLHHEMELAVALGETVFRANRVQSVQAVFGYGCALDMTRRDLQAKAKEKRRPWDLGKDFEGAVVLAPLTRAGEWDPVVSQAIRLKVNGEMRQDATLDQMIHNVAAIISDLSQYYHLRAGDVILTGTPAGVGAVKAGDQLVGQIDGLEPVRLTLGAAV